LTFKNKVKEAETLEKEELMPIANALLYRKLVDKKGTGNHRNLSSIRDFVLDTVAGFREVELDRLIETMFMTFGLNIYDKDQEIDFHKILTLNTTSRVIGLVETLNNVIKKLGV
jgi:nucleotidyltransferase/DNA polymerase involved in DNA repair